METFLIKALVLAILLALMYKFDVVPFGMALTTIKDTGGIGMGGGNIAYLREVTSAGVDLGTPDTNHSAGHLDESSLDDVPTTVKKYAEDGGLTFVGISKRDVTFKLMMQQSGLTHLGMVEEVRNKYYRLYYQRAPLQNGKVQEFMFGICRVIPELKLAFKEGEVVIVPATVEVLKNSSAITIANNTLPTEKVTADAMDIAANKYYSMKETTPA